MNNLPTDDQNNQPPIVKPENPPTPLPESPKTIEPTIIPDANPPEINPEVIPNDIKEQSIEIGAIDSLEKPSFSTYTQGTTDNFSTSAKKSKKGKIIASVLAILLIVTSLPISIMLVKQRQDIRKNASESQAAFNDIQITFESETAPSTANGGIYSTNFKVANNVSSTRTVVVEKNSCYCSSGSPSACNDNCSPTNVTLTIGGHQSTNVTISSKQPSGAICGSFQTDLTVISVK
ncbi:MAG: hypothetical protein NT052_02550 [Candidatus Shapirobacteria bacterium]|nr:hypothetical protein [Candidatus Shapirobacteria bacterium]